MAGLDIKEIVELALLLIATGALSGFLAGVFGIGGGAILVPVFYECFRIAGVPLEVRMPLCVGTSLAVIIPTSIRSFQAHYKRGAVDMAILRVWWLPIVIGVVAGSVVARHAPERLFKIVFVCVAWSAAVRLIFARETWKLGDDLPKGPVMRIYGFCVGILSTLMGIGGGLFSNLLMTFYGPADPSGGRDVVGARGTDLDPRRARLHLCRLAGGGELPGRRSAASPVRARLRLADRGRAGNADEPRHRAARRESRACDVEANAGDRVRVLPVHRRQPVCGESGGRAVDATSSVIASAAKQSRISPRRQSGLLRCARNDVVERARYANSNVVLDKLAQRAPIRDPLPQGVVWRRLVIASFVPQLLPGVMGPGFRQDDSESAVRFWSNAMSISSRRYPCRYPAARSSAPCPWCCAAARRPRRRASAS
ncbi:hypothetical protein ACVIQW_007547 [Bradyrhizobium diazoefficiens]